MIQFHISDVSLNCISLQQLQVSRHFDFQRKIMDRSVSSKSLFSFLHGDDIPAAGLKKYSLRHFRR